ncbi:MAG TPA: orotate phosphoribosyltransferase, partial [Aquabacterium sp.]|nr:orotate phosphoribosyltransferase [Aquabacterium sp.]
GTSVRESIDLILKAGATPAGVTIALDRQEKATANGQDATESAVQQVEQHYKLPVVSIATLGDLLQYLQSQSDPALNAAYPSVLAYRQRYGV